MPDVTVKSYFSELINILPFIEKAQRKIDCETGNRFNLFHRYLSGHETMLSRILRDLLDPRGPHGQGVVFLKLFLDELGIDHEVNEEIEVHCEVPTIYIENNERRIDIVITAKNFIIGIENKPWTGNQDNQLEDYMSHLEGQCKGKIPLEHCYIAYIPGEGQDPTDENSRNPDQWKAKWKELEKAERAKTLPYNADDNVLSLRHWLKHCVIESKSDKVRWFLRDFESYVETFSKYQPKQIRENKENNS